jgi:hypothetical protein
MLAMTSVVFAAEVEENPGTPFERVYRGLDQANEGLVEANEKLDGNFQAILDTTREIRDLAGGATRWVAPHWRVQSGNVVFDKTLVRILNTSFVSTAIVDINVYDDSGEFDVENSRQVEVLPRHSREYEPDSSGISDGWMEVVSDRNVFVDGEHQLIVDADSGASRTARNMAWYPADSEADLE